ncbi:hypothetical protein [Metamycoplasma hominis]|uniref:hypothetical protein n=1 Tax=Metamycoplasma hominis TaxID=2098 RepID=UPI0005CCF159|nr:hypothetical protein [Metamycoplasma hominis]
MNKKIGILLSISLLATAATTATIAAIAAKGKFKKQQELKQNIEKSKAELNKAKSILEKLLKSDYAKNVNKLEESKILDNAKIDENSSLQDIKNKTKQVKEAINSLTQKILERKQKEQQNQNDKKTLDKLRLDFANAQEELKALINSRDGKSVDTTKAAEVLKNTKITNSSAAFQVLQAVQTIKKATKELQEAIKFKKQQEFNEFNKAKQELANYIANDLKDLKYKDIKAKAEKSIEKVSDININSSFISDIQQATKLLIDAKKQAISEVEKINKSSELDKYKIAKNKLELLIKTEDAQMIKSANEKAKKILAENTTKDTTLSSEEFKTRRINLENALDELKEAIKNEKNIQKQEFEAKKQELKTLLESEWSKDIDKKNETAVWNNAKIDDSDSIKEIKEATKEVQGAIDSLIQKMDEKNKLNPLYAKEKFEKIQKQLQDLINSEDAKFIDTNKASETLKNTKITSTSSIDEINQAIKTLKDTIVELKNAINGAKEDSIKEFDKVKKDLEVLVGSEDAKSIEKRTEIGILANTYILERDTIKQIKEKTEAIKKAISSLNSKIENAKALKNELQKFNDIKAALEQLIKTDDAKEVGTEDASKALNNNKVNDLITSSGNQAPADAISDAQKTLDEINKLNLTNVSTIKSMKDATQKIEAANKALKQAIEKLKAEKLQKFNEAKTALENLVKEEDAIQTGVEAAKKVLEDNNANNLIASNNKQAPADAISAAQKTLDEINKLNLTNVSTIKSLKDATQKIKDANEALKQAIEKLEAEKTEKLQKFNEAKKALEDLIKDEDAKEVGTNNAQKLLEDNNKINKNSSIDEITNATKALDEAKSKLGQKIKAKKQELMASLKEKNEKLDTLLKTENLDDLMVISKRPDDLNADEIKNKLEKARKLSQEARDLSENSKITDINQKIQKIDEFVGKLESWIKVMEEEKKPIAHRIKFRIENLKQIKANEFYSVFLDKFKRVLEKPIFNNPSWTKKLSDLKKADEDSDNLWKLCQLFSQYKNDTNLSPALQKKLAKEFEKILAKETIPSDSEITELENKLKKIVEEDPTTEFSNLQNEAKDTKKLIENLVPESAKELDGFKKLQSWINNALKLIEEGYNSALQKEDLDALKVETSKINNLNKLIKLFYTYWKQFNDLISDEHDQREVFRRGIKDADEAINALGQINLNQEIGNDELMNEKTKEIENKLATAQSLTESHFKH